MSEMSYHLHMPEALTSCVVFASPHSGRDYPDSFCAPRSGRTRYPHL